MNETLTPAVSPRATGQSLARLGAGHGYRFDGDTVLVNAMFRVMEPAAHDRAWALQLWACPAVPKSAGEIRGHLVAQAPLPPIGEIADETDGFEVAAFAAPPAGHAEQVMVLALVSLRAGECSEIHDLAVYPRRERFILPRLGGKPAWQINSGRAHLAVESIENPRSAGNLSGGLSLELWALPAAYEGGAFSGACLAGVALGALPGGGRFEASAFDLPLTPPPAGQWRLTLMLREWTAAGFLTRDFFNFDAPFVQAGPAPVAAKPAPAPAEKKSIPADSHLVSVNHADAGALAQIKGLSQKVAAAIVKERPFRSLDELTRVKGMGAKLLARVRAHLKL